MVIDRRAPVEGQVVVANGVLEFLGATLRGIQVTSTMGILLWQLLAMSLFLLLLNAELLLNLRVISAWPIGMKRTCQHHLQLQIKNSSKEIQYEACSLFS